MIISQLKHHPPATINQNVPISRASSSQEVAKQIRVLHRRHHSHLPLQRVLLQRLPQVRPLLRRRRRRIYLYSCKKIIAGGCCRREEALQLLERIHRHCSRRCRSRFSEIEQIDCWRRRFRRRFHRLLYRSRRHCLSSR